MNFENWTCRASVLGTIMTGTIGLTQAQNNTLQSLLNRQAEFDAGDVKKKLTDKMVADMEELLKKQENREIPKTVQSELRKVYRSLKYNRDFNFTNKYLQKGIHMEEASITILSKHLDRPLLKYKGDRVFGTHFQGQPDIVEKKKGWDVKSSWSLQTFPWPDDDLDSIYEWQNQAYMELFAKDEWTTAKCLVNPTDRILMNEVNKHWYAMGQPELDDPLWVEMAKSVERDMIVDMAQFQNHYPYYSMMYHQEGEWQHDIPEEERIVLFHSYRSDEKIKEAKERVEICRSYLSEIHQKFSK